MMSISQVSAAARISTFGFRSVRKSMKAASQTFRFLRALNKIELVVARRFDKATAAVINSNQVKESKLLLRERRTWNILAVNRRLPPTRTIFAQRNINEREMEN